MPKAKEAPPEPNAHQHPGKIHCYRCGFEWWPKNPEKVPTVCARCKNPRYAIPRTIAEVDTPTRSEADALDNYLMILRRGGSFAASIRKIIDDAAKTSGTLF